MKPTINIPKYAEPTLTDSERELLEKMHEVLKGRELFPELNKMAKELMARAVFADDIFKEE